MEVRQRPDHAGVVTFAATAGEPGEREDLKRFQEFIESRPTETGGWRGDVSRPDV